MTRWRGPFRSAALCAMPFAIVAPIAPWWLSPALGAGLVASWSWLAFLAAWAGLCVRDARFIVPGLLAGVVLAVVWAVGRLERSWALLEWTPRGDSLDPIAGRLAVLLLALSRLSWRGRGRGSLARDLRRWRSRGVAYGPLEHLHCEPVQLVYERGWRGGLVVLGLTAALAAWLQSGDPHAAAGVSTAVLCLGHSPFRVFADWARRRFLRTNLVAEVTLHVREDGTTAVFTVNVPSDSPEVIRNVAAAIIRGGFYWAEQRGLSLHPLYRMEGHDAGRCIAD